MGTGRASDGSTPFRYLFIDSSHLATVVPRHSSIVLTPVRKVAFRLRSGTTEHTMSECDFAHALRLLYFDGRIRSCQQVLLQETRSDGCLERRSRKRNTSHTPTFVSDPEFQSHFQPHCIPLSQPRSAVVACLP